MNKQQLAAFAAVYGGENSGQKRRTTVRATGVRSPGTRARRSWKKRRRTSGKGGKR